MKRIVIILVSLAVVFASTSSCSKADFKSGNLSKNNIFLQNAISWKLSGQEKLILAQNDARELYEGFSWTTYVVKEKDYSKLIRQGFDPTSADMLVFYEGASLPKRGDKFILTTFRVEIKVVKDDVLIKRKVMLYRFFTKPAHQPKNIFEAFKAVSV